MFYKKIKNNRGFTLIELLAVIAIFGILTAITVGNYSKFTSDVVLTNMAYELALSIREAQVYGISVINQGGGTFNDKYGINFTENSSNYVLFVDKNDNDIYDNNNEFQKTYTLQRGVSVNVLRNRQECANVSKLDILFKRPNPEPIIDKQRDISAEIGLVSREGTKKYVIVSGSGQIYVTSTPQCSD